MSGITYTSKDLSIWRERASNGPYKSTGDAFTESPSAWDDVVTRANLFMNDTITDYWDDDINADSTTYSKGHYLLAAAFYGLIMEDDTYRLKAKNAVLLQAQNTTNPDFESLIGDVYAWGNVFHFANFTTRLFHAFDYTYDLWTAPEIAIYETWMDRAITAWLDISNHYRDLNFPNRYSGDYDTRSWWALTGQKYDPAKYTHVDDQGVAQNQGYWAHRYGNGEANYGLSILIWGLYKNDQSLITDFKMYIKETLMFATWPDGMTHDQFRNGDYGRPATGAHWYVSICLEAFAYGVLLLKRRGDNELINFTTSYGIWGTEGGPKNLELVHDTHVALNTSTIDRYYDSVSEANRLDPLAGTYRHRASEQAIAMSNLLFNKPESRTAYRNEAPGSIPYDPGYGGDSYTWAVHGGSEYNYWIGATGVFPALPLQYYETELICKPRQGAAFDCADPIQPGLLNYIQIINRDDIESYAVTDGAVSNITLKPGKFAYLFQGVRQSIDARYEEAESGFFSTGYKHYVDFSIFDIASSQKVNIEKLCLNQLVAITFLSVVPGNDNTYFEIYGLGPGLETGLLERQNYGGEYNGAWRLNLQTPDDLKEAKLPYTYWNIDYETSKGDLEGLLPVGDVFPFIFPFQFS